MSDERVIVDAGPLVAILNRHDAYHSICYQQGLQLPRPLLTTWPVLTEASWLLRRTHGGVSRLLQMMREQLLDCYELDIDAAIWMEEFLVKYSDLDAQLADASLMYVAEKERIETIFTLDRRDFFVYRLSRDRVLKLVPEQLNVP